MNDQIAHALRSARKRDGRIDVDEAVNGVFAQPRRKYAFLFNQNARRTNMQLAEFISLIRQHIYVSDTRTKQSEIEFTTFEEIKTFLTEVISHTNGECDKDFSSFVDEITLFLNDKIIIEAHYGTASVFLPPHIDLDIALVCGESGYIHSCGDLLLLRNAEKVTESMFKDAILECINDFRTEEDRFLLVPYCHEDFTHLDRESSPFLQHGLDDVKIHISKAYMGATKLYDLLEQIGEEQQSDLAIAPAGNFKKSSEAFQEAFPDKIQNTIFLISDSDLVPGSRFPGSKKFYVLYLQQYKNNNVYHLYDENKPGWASHTTLPHSLAGSMVSIARPWFKEGGKPKIADPFGGSGTVFFEAQKISGIDCQSSDQAPIFQFTIEDNAKFFNLDRESLKKLRDELSGFLNLNAISVDPTAARSRKETPEQRLIRVVDVVRKWSGVCNDNFLSLEKGDLDDGFRDLGDNQADRLLAYVGLRASVRGLTDISRQTASWPTFFNRELSQLLVQIDNELTWLGNARSHPHNSQMLLSRSAYSDSTRPRPPEIRHHDLLKTLHFDQADVINMPKDTYDAIITDPPYGFNTDEDYWPMAAFVRKMIDAMVLALKSEGGQLILAAPQMSFSGKGIMPFVRSDYLSREIVRACARLGRECVKPSVVLPASLSRLQPPYYWVAEKTLERRILHFWIREQRSE